VKALFEASIRRKMMKIPHRSQANSSGRTSPQQNPGGKMLNTRRSFMLAGTAAAGSALLTARGVAHAELSLPFPRISDTSAATPELVDFINGFFAAKTRANVAGAMAYFSPRLVTYSDAVLGWDLAGYDSLRAVWQKHMPNWGTAAKSYPSRILGDMTSALVTFTDTAELFGGEIRAIGAIDMQDGKIVRWVDYWDTRGWPNTFGVRKGALPNWHMAALRENASPRLRGVVSRLAAAMSANDSKSAAALFSYDATYEDMVCRAQVLGRSAIERYLERALAMLPNGATSGLRHTVGADAGGGFEWIGAQGSPIAGGITALVLDADGAITRATTVYDGALFGASHLQSLAALALDP